MNKIAENLRALRINNNKSKEDLAVYLGITVDSYARYENSTRQPNPDTLIKLAIFYGCTLDYLMGRDSIEMTMLVRSDYISYKELLDMGYNGKLSHGLIKQIWDKLPFEERMKEYTSNLVKKEDLRGLLMNLLEDVK